MFLSMKIKEWLKWPLVRAHLCTLAVSVSLNSTWRVPREGARFGGLPYGLALSAALVAVALPLALLQLAVGQLSQQDAVGMWLAVPVLRGVGYLRLLISFLGSIYAVIYLALTAAYFLYTLSSSIPFIECTDIVYTEEGYQNVFNSSNCLDVTFMAPVREHPEYYIAMSLIILVTWIGLPFLLYSPVKLMKRVFYALGPLVVVLGVAVAAGMGGRGRLAWLVQAEDWSNFLQPHIWFGAVTQALISSEVAGGYLVLAGDSIYSDNNVKWTALALIGTNMLASWCGLVLWFAVAGGDGMETGSAAVLSAVYRVSANANLPIVWPLLAFAALFMSGVITMLVRLLPMYERIRRSCGTRWRVACAACALACACASLAALAGGWRALAVLEELAVPLLAAAAAVLEAIAFIFIYGWKVLMADIEFLTGDKLGRWWVAGWWLAPIAVAASTAWWAVAAAGGDWLQPPWSPAVLAATGALLLIVVLLFAVAAVARQVQYDIIGKLKSSFKPSRHWGPRDPISHYYWMSRREEAERGNPTSSRHRRRQPGQIGRYRNVTISDPVSHAKAVDTNEVKRRTNSDDWIYTVYRKKYLEEIFPSYLPRTKQYRSKSLDWVKLPSLGRKRDSMEVKIINCRYDAAKAEAAAAVRQDMEAGPHCN